MTQDVHYTTRTFPPGGGVLTAERQDHNLDHTVIWGAHTQYMQPVGGDGWRIGWLATANRLSHPKIPNYQLQNIPRDPGTTYGYNIGVGAGRVVRGTSFGIDVIDEPMFSSTWGTAGVDTTGATGIVIRAGDRTVSNKFNFSNATVRIGLGHEITMAKDSSSAFGFQLGLVAHSINYRLRQTNHVQGTSRVQDEGWTEWTPTLGFRWRTRDFEMVYTYRRTCGPSACIDLAMGDKVNLVAPNPGGIIAAPSSPLTIDGGTSHLHRIMMSVPIR
jgi:hypothetical protein